MEKTSLKMILHALPQDDMMELEQMIEHEGLIDVFYERAFERLIPQGHTFRIVDTTNFFSIELDTPEDFENAKQFIPAALY